MREIEVLEPVGSSWVELRVGVYAPARLRLTRGLPKVEGSAVVGVESPTLTAEFVAEPGGAIRVVKVTVEEREDRPLPVSYVKRTALERRARDEIGALLMGDPFERVPVPGDPDFLERLRARKVRRMDTAAAVKDPKPKPGPTPADLREAARIYRETTSPARLEAVADALGISVATASRRIKDAKAAGIDVGEQGRGGERRTDEVEMRIVVEAVKYAQANGLPVGETVRSRLPRDMYGNLVSMSTARRKIRAAREAGLLPETKGEGK